MPTENELKFVLSNEPYVQETAKSQAYDVLYIQQAYLKRKGKLSVRVRRKESIGTGKIEYLLQTKYDTKHSVNFNHFLKTNEIITDQPNRLIEISAHIDHRDFLDLWKKAKGKVTKNRYLIKSQTANAIKDENGEPWQEVWEVDFLTHENAGTYFVQAEVELPETATEPLFDMPEFIRRKTVFRVPLGDSRFSNSRLGNIRYTKQLYESLFNLT